MRKILLKIHNKIIFFVQNGKKINKTHFNNILYIKIILMLNLFHLSMFLFLKNIIYHQLSTIKNLY